MEWYEIEGTDGMYSISKEGLILTNATGNIRVGDITSQGYRELRCYKKGKQFYRKLVHVILAEMFLEKPDGDYIVDHKDNNKQNNYLDNLHYITRVENFAKAIPYRKRTIVPVNQYDKDGNFIATHKSIKDALISLGKNPCSPIIGYACRGRCSTNNVNTAYGFKWKFVEDDDIVRPPQ